jgi:DNA-binding transcriptional regulator YiaG
MKPYSMLIRKVDDLSPHCSVTGVHWLWEGRLDRGRPKVYVPGYGNCAGALVVARLQGRESERQPHQRWFMACGQALCLSPKCLRLGTVPEQMASSARAGRLVRRPDSLRRNSLARQRRGDTLPDELIGWVRDSSQTNIEIAHSLGVSKSAVSNWRRGVTRSPVFVGAFSQLLRLAA